MSKPVENAVENIDRRKFLGVSAATAAMLIEPELVFGTAANSAVRVGLLGCGGRGTDDASTLIESANARVVALADLFEDQLQTAKVHFDQLQQAKGFPALESWQLFLGPHAYAEISAAKDVDAIVIATP